MERDCDVVIIGAGMVGATLACCLAGEGRRVALVDATQPPPGWSAGSVDVRVSALTEASRQIFLRLGAWSAMAELGVSPFSRMHVWDAGGAGSIRFDCADIGAPQLGHIVENRVMQSALLARAREIGGIALHCPVALESLTPGTESIRLALSDGAVLDARLVVGADGAASRVRQLAGINTRGWGYDQQALVATVTTERPHEWTAWQRFLSEGPLAFLPLRDGRSSIVWSTTPAWAQELIRLSDAEFMEQLAEAFEWKLGRVTAVEGRAAFPLRLQHSITYTAPRVALIGDAAHVIHPLAGQGVNLGLLDAAALAETVLDAAACGGDIGAPRVLRRYERWRKGDNLQMMLAMDGFKRLFGSSMPPLRLARNLGLDLADAATPLKHAIIRRAMGLRGDLPRLARQAYI
ncbi:MAG: UbiH/UbiF/VisC/COQ6 family ubiquinone biosynthesis hydroxylase [Gammaproteobacteria bacterium]|nr:UbiH/UbiF/VisC/COQ6 family ubiquinone biosynthesis hydroxylase [Gammaproteobacteria bacterium]